MGNFRKILLGYKRKLDFIKLERSVFGSRRPNATLNSYNMVVTWKRFVG